MKPRGGIRQNVAACSECPDVTYEWSRRYAEHEAHQATVLAQEVWDAAH